MLTVGSLFSGGGGLDLAVEEVFGACTAWQCEPELIRDADDKPWRPNPARKVLAARWPNVPNLGDITAVNWAAVEPVDIICGGFPCQDVSAAGRRAGIAADTRSGLWSHMAAAIAHLRPAVVVVENVRGLLSARAHRHMEPDDTAVGDRRGGPVLRAAGAVCGDLADLGYDAQWATVSAARVGAPHRRERVFIVATDAARDGRHEGWPESAGQLGRHDAAVSGDGPVALLPTPAASRSGNNQSPSPGAAVRPSLDSITDLLPTPSVADDGGGHLTRSGARGDELLLPGVAQAYAKGALLPTPRVSDHFGPGLHGDGGMDLRTAVSLLPEPVARQWGPYGPAIRRWESVTRPAPSPTEPNSTGGMRLAPAFSEWMQGWPAGWVTDPALGISRNDQLRLIGNGVVTQQASAALRLVVPYAVVA